MKHSRAWPCLVCVAAVLFLIPASRAAALPSVGADASASASEPGSAPPPDLDSDPVTASAQLTADVVDFAEAQAEATVGGPVRSRSEVSAASGDTPSQAAGAASFVSQLLVGGVDPGAPVDLDLLFSVDGFLDVFNNNSNVGVDDIYAEVAFRVTLHDAVGAVGVFDGTARLGSISRTELPALTRSGDWADAARDGDFAFAGCSAFSCRVDVDALVSEDDAALVAFGSTVALELELLTAAFVIEGNELEAESDFFGTGSVTLSTDTPGIVFVPVPEPGSAALAALGLALLGVRRRATRAAARRAARLLPPGPSPTF